jgi:hypothetical protein
MKIPVIFIDGTPGVVGDEELESFVRMRRIFSFHRSDGWVQVSKDSLRDPSNKNTFEGKERRKA